MSYWVLRSFLAIGKGTYCVYGSAGLGGRPTLTKVQVGLVSSARKLKKNLDKIAAAADTSDSEGLQGLLQGKLRLLVVSPMFCGSER